MLTMKMINLPLLVLFGLCYALGHPTLASYRPVLVDKTLASFHEDVNRTITGTTHSVAKIFEPEAASGVAPVMKSQPVTFAVANAEPVPLMAPKPIRLAELPRQKNGGFTVLSAQ